MQGTENGLKRHRFERRWKLNDFYLSVRVIDEGLGLNDVMFRLPCYDMKSDEMGSSTGIRLVRGGRLRLLRLVEGKQVKNDGGELKNAWMLRRLTRDIGFRLVLSQWTFITVLLETHLYGLRRFPMRLSSLTSNPSRAVCSYLMRIRAVVLLKGELSSRRKTWLRFNPRKRKVKLSESVVERKMRTAEKLLKMSVGE